jgi:tetratricopeptide (TPR) repeat protein
VTVDVQRLEQQRDQALRDLLDLDRQVADGELPTDVADELRAGYERSAATALAALSEAGEEQAPPVPESQPRSRARLLAYALALAAAVFAAAVLLPTYLAERQGGAVTGNEVFDAAPPDSPDGPASGRDLSTVTNEELEQVVNQNPDVIDMRLALAHRYLDDGVYADAARHYLVALRQEPGDVEALSHYGWLMLQVDDPAQAEDYVDRALEQDPGYVEGLWFKANIALYGLDDPAGALTVLEQLQQRTDLSPTVREQVDTLIGEARNAETQP